MRPGLSTVEGLRVNRDYLNIALKQLRQMSNVGTSFSGNVQRDVSVKDQGQYSRIISSRLWSMCKTICK